MFAVSSLLCLLIVSSPSVFSQKKVKVSLTEVYDTNAVKKDTAAKNVVAQEDIPDVFRRLFRKKSSADTTPEIAKIVYTVVPAIGYTLQTKLTASVPGNAAFRLSPDARLSTITASVAYSQNKQFFIPVQSNISTKGNRYRFVGDLRFYKYPQSTFGLGSNSSVACENPMDYTYFRFYETVLRKIIANLYAGAGYNLDYHWNISDKGNKNGTTSDYEKYGTAKHTVSSGVTLNALYDSRDNIINPLKGFYAGMQWRNNLTALGSNSNWNSLIIDVRKYFTFPGKSQNVLAFWYYNYLVLQGKPPYLDLPATAWDNYNNTGRGYIQGRFRGDKMVYFETEYRFRITQNGLLGGVLFVNNESFSTVPGSSLQSIQTGYGTGLRIKLQKESRTNLSVDYGFGSQHSNGLFITVGEVF